jgi:hypothetical protein
MFSITLTAAGQINSFWQAVITSITPITNPSDEEQDLLQFPDRRLDEWSDATAP